MITAQDSLPTGSLEDVEQAEEHPFVPISVPVTVENVVPVHTTGSKHGASFNKKVNTVDGAVNVLGVNPRRRIVRILSDQAFYVSNMQAGLSSGYAALWLANTVLEITHTDEIWVYLPIDGVVSVMSEDWAD